MNKPAIVLAALLTLGSVAAQDLAGTIQGVYGEVLGSATTVTIPNYGQHGVVRLTTTQVTPEAALDAALGVFNALAAQIGGTVSVSVHARASFNTNPYVLLFQHSNGVTSVYLDGQPFD